MYKVQKQNIQIKINVNIYFVNLDIDVELQPIESRKGISPLRSHGTVRESLLSYGSSCL